MVNENVQALLPFETATEERQLAKVEEFRQQLLACEELPEIHGRYAMLSGLQTALNNYRNVTFKTLHSVASLQREAERIMGKQLLLLLRKPGDRSDLTT